MTILKEALFVALFKKLFKKKKKEEKREESWYNNYHEKVEKAKWRPADDPGALSSPNGVYIGISHANEKPQ